MHSDRADEHVVAVVVRGWPGVRRDLVLARVRPHRQRVPHLDPAQRRLPCRQEDVRARLVHPRGGWLIPYGASRKYPAWRSSRLPNDARRVERGHAEPVDRPVGRDERAGVAVRRGTRSPRSAGTATARPRSVALRRRRAGTCASWRLRRAYAAGLRHFLLPVAHATIQGPCQRPWPSTSVSASFGPQLPGA